MDILYLLIPSSAVLVLFIIGIFAWALHAGQFDDLDQQGKQILVQESQNVDLDQTPLGAPTKESPSGK